MLGKLSYIYCSLYYDDKLKRWVDPNADPNEADGSDAPPPPTDMQLSSGASANPNLPPSIGNSKQMMPPGVGGGNKFAGMLPRSGQFINLGSEYIKVGYESESNQPF